MPENIDQRINELLIQYVDKRISEADFKELFEYLSQTENRHIFDDFMKKSEKETLPDITANHVDWDHMYQQIVENGQEKPKFGLIINIGKKLTIAASLVMMVYLGYQLYYQPKVIHTVTAVPKQDLEPGKNKAILTLADGSKIILDDKHNGMLTKQGVVDISKSDQGTVVYSAKKTAPSEKIYINTLSTPRGGHFKLMLPDKTTVWLNAESSITFPSAFTGNERKVKVTGETYFEVSKNRNKPFLVESGEAQVEVLGTHFNVNVYPNEENSAVTLLEGSVKLNRQAHSKKILPGQQAIFNRNSDRIDVRYVDVDNVVDWKNGLFIFEDATVPEVMRQIERWYDVDVKYIGQIPGIKFNGALSRSNNVSKLLKLLRAAGNIEFHIHNKTIEVKQISKTP
ncbi:FecR family protein [uncultured Pedobacter sp.]|uniref:FecR family protein n=1 Tax=uncultured Pedobacter sp. TaxID=246139 RepID=UPI0025FD849D|nr:FecR family protein [uncultured Pedobacter sp.]